MPKHEQPFLPAQFPEGESVDEVSLQLAIERIEAGLLDGVGNSLVYSDNDNGYFEGEESKRAWVAGSFLVAEPDPFAPLVAGRMLTEITYDASVIRNPRDFGGLSMMLVRETDPEHFLQYDFYEDGKVYVPNDRGLHASLPEGERGRELSPEEIKPLQKQLATAAGFGKPRF